jgi:hypothetical protein
MPFDFAAATAGTLIGVTGVSMQAHAGPLPSPSILAGYRDVDPTFPDRILAMAKANAATERRTAERAQIFQLAEQIVSRFFGAAFAVTAPADSHLACQQRPRYRRRHYSRNDRRRHHRGFDYGTPAFE